MFRRLLVASVIAGMVGVPAAISGSGTSVARCTQKGALDATCTDPVGDVKGGPGPDITRVNEAVWGVIVFQVTFLRAPVLHTTAFTDTVSVELTARTPSVRHYLLSVSSDDPTHVVLRRLPNGKPIVVAPTGRVFGKSVSLNVSLNKLGAPATVSFRVKASRAFADGRQSGVDWTPDRGTMTVAGGNGG
jgi:hypothetical protein